MNCRLRDVANETSVSAVDFPLGFGESSDVVLSYLLNVVVLDAVCHFFFNINADR